MSYRIKSILSGALLSGALWAASGSAHASSCRWIGPDNGAWNNAVNWSTKTVPGASDDVIIEGKKKVAVPFDATVANLTVGGGAEIKNGGKIRVTGKTSSSGLFTGTGTLEVPAGATASYTVDSSSLLATAVGTVTPVVFAPIINNGQIITKVASGCRVDFASVQNSGSTQVTSDGTVTFKDIKNGKDLNVSASGTLTFAKIENAAGASLSIEATTPPIAGLPIFGRHTNGKLGDLIDPSVVHLDDLTNRAGGKIKLSGIKGGRLFDGKSINNQGDMEISGAQTLLESDVTNGPGATLTLNSDATLFPSGSSAPKLNNSGKIIKSAGSDATLKVEWTNTGQVVVEDGTLHVRVPAGKGCKQTDGVTTFEGGTLAVEDPLGLLPTGTFEVAGGIVNGIGTITGNVVNSGGHFKPGHSPGTITINGSFTQTAGGVLDMEVGGTTPGTTYDQILVNGTAYLGGTLNMIRWGDFTPQDGDVYTLLTYYAKSGNFSKFADATPVQGITYDTTLTPTDLELNCYAEAMDTTSPNLSITTPVNSGAVRSITGATGKASDAGGLASITCRLYRYPNPVTGAAAAFWAGGSSWTSTETAANERPATGTTAWTFAFPPLVVGRYSLRATATDAAGNVTVCPTIAFWVDPNAPNSLTVATPANGSIVSSLSQISGTATDAADGSGVTSVKYQLKRMSDNTYWNGTAWATASYSFATNLSGTGWSRTTTMPSGLTLPAGKYSIIATATDRAGNTKSLTTSFTVSSTTTSTKTA